MKGILKFNLPEEREEFDMAINAGKYYCALWDIEHKIRSMLKYEEKDTIDTEELKNIFYSILEDNGIKL